MSSVELDHENDKCFLRYGIVQANLTDAEAQKPIDRVAEPTTIRVPSSSRDLYYT